MSALATTDTAVSRLVGDLKEFGGLNGRDIANIFGVSPPTVTRWSQGAASPPIDKQTAMAQLRWVAQRLSEFYEPGDVRLWLQSPHPQLGNQRPYDLIVDGRSPEVLEVIERLDTGVFLQVASAHRGHDDRLLDALGALDGDPFVGTMWRVVRVGRSVLDGSRGAGRWNPASLSVLYGAEEGDGAVAEMHFHLNRGQSVFPSRMEHDLFDLRIQTKATLVLADMDALAKLGVDRSRYGEMLYARTQEIAAAAAFMGFDGIIAPSARWACRNIVLFLDSIAPDGIEVGNATRIDWKAWRDKHAQRASAHRPDTH